MEKPYFSVRRTDWNKMNTLQTNVVFIATSLEDVQTLIQESFTCSTNSDIFQEYINNEHLETYYGRKILSEDGAVSEINNLIINCHYNRHSCNADKYPITTIQRIV